ncbi:MAG: hypothetical protein KJ597_03775 [Nanoarchaeota archaeon]|nr:hypothetical protein [Nanoarchaeota archaeon]MBU1622665.1 hypothetical protein [Nanoarchaeota archaeon]
MIFIKGKKGMEMWQIVLLVLAILLLLFLIGWYGGLDQKAGGFLDKLANLI